MTVLASEPDALDSPDYAAGSVLRSLARPITYRSSWGLAKTLVLTALSFGLAPLLIWPRLLRDLINAERDRYQHLAEWMRGISGDRALPFLAAAGRIRPQPVLSILPVMIPLLVIGEFVMMYMRYHPTQESVFNSTWGYGRTIQRDEIVTQLYFVWTGGLLLAYVLHWCQLLLHTSRVRDAVTEFNHLVGAEGLAPASVESDYGLRPAWLIAGVIMMASGSALWAIPAMLGGAVQRRYATAGVPRVQSLLAMRVQQLLSHRRPAMFVPTPVARPRKCINDRCRAPIAKVANFCPRCGTHIGPEVNALA